MAITLPGPPVFDQPLTDDTKKPAEYWRKWLYLLWKALYLAWTNPTAPSFKFANLPASPAVGMYAVVTDSNTVTWGATIAGGSTHKVLAFYNGSNWTVAGS